MRNPFFMTLPHRCVKISQYLLGFSLTMLLLSACGGGAHTDFNLNTGEATESTSDASAVFVSGGSADGAASWTYEIQEGDQLEVVFFTHPEQNRFVKVRPDGRISMPFVGDMEASGKEPSDLAKEIQDAYASVLVDPRIDVLIQDSGARFYVLGEVGNAGEFKYERRISLMQAVARAAGYSNSARLNNIVLLRKNDDGEAFAAVLDFRDFLKSDNRVANIEIQPFDIIWVPRSAVSRWDNATRKLFSGVLAGQESVIKGWSLVNFSDVFEKQRF